MGPPCDGLFFYQPVNFFGRMVVSWGRVCYPKKSMSSPGPWARHKEECG